MLSDTLILDPVRGALLGALNGKFWPYWKKLAGGAAGLPEHIEKLRFHRLSFWNSRFYLWSGVGKFFGIYPLQNRIIHSAAENILSKNSPIPHIWWSRKKSPKRDLITQASGTTKHWTPDEFDFFQIHLVRMVILIIEIELNSSIIINIFITKTIATSDKIQNYSRETFEKCSFLPA